MWRRCLTFPYFFRLYSLLFPLFALLFKKGKVAIPLLFVILFIIPVSVFRASNGRIFQWFPFNGSFVSGWFENETVLPATKQISSVEKLVVKLRGGTISEFNKVWSMMYKSWNDSRFKDLVLHFRLPMDKGVSEYSIGMKTLLFLILTVSTDSKILILDELTQHLVPVWKDDALSIIRSYAQRGNTIILSTHQVEEAELMATRFAIIRSGRVLYSDELDAAKENHRVVRVEEMEEELEQITVMNNDTVLVKTIDFLILHI